MAILGVIGFALLVSVAARADDTGITSALAVREGAGLRPITPNMLANYLDAWIPTATPKLLIFAECYGGGFTQDPRFTDALNTATVSASLADQPALYTGYHDDAARALRPEAGRTAATMHQAGVDGLRNDASAREDPTVGAGMPLAEFSLAPVSEAGAVQSRHVIVYAGRPDSGIFYEPDTTEPLRDENGHALKASDAQDRDAIRENFSAEPRTTVRGVGGDPNPNNPAMGTKDWDYPGDHQGLLRALREAHFAITAAPDPSKEQFILFVTDHGVRVARQPTRVVAPPGTGTALTRNLRSLGAASVRLAMLFDPSNQPGFEVVMPADGQNVPLRRDGVGAYIPYYAPGQFRLEVVPAGGAPVVLETFSEQYTEFADDVIGNQPGESISFFFPADETTFTTKLLDTTLSVTLFNDSPMPVLVGEVTQTTGAIRMGPYRPVPCDAPDACLAELGAAVPSVTGLRGRARRLAVQVRRLVRQLGRIVDKHERRRGTRKAKSLLARMRRLVARLERVVGRGAARGHFAGDAQRLTVPARGVLAFASAGGRGSSTTTTTTRPDASTTTTLPPGRAVAIGTVLPGGPGVGQQICLSLIAGGCVAPVHLPNCDVVHLHSAIGITIAGVGGPFADPFHTQGVECGYGGIVTKAECGLDRIPDCH